MSSSVHRAHSLEARLPRSVVLAVLIAVVVALAAVAIVQQQSDSPPSAVPSVVDRTTRPTSEGGPLAAGQREARGIPELRTGPAASR